MLSRHSLSRRAALCISTSVVSLMLASGAFAQSTDVGSVDVQSGGGGGLPVSAPNAVGSKAPPGSAPALAPSQGKLDAIEPVSIVSDKMIKDIAPPGSDYNAVAQYTPGFLTNNANGLAGDTKGGWRGYQDGQFNITFDGIPFGDENDPTHHSGAYFPAPFIGSMTIDRGPGSASQVGYATFGGTQALNSVGLSDTMGGSVDMSYGSFGTFTTAATFQFGKLDDGTRALVQYAHSNTNGALEYGDDVQNAYLGKIEKTFGDVKVTLFSSYGRENYNNVGAITWQQLQLYGKSYGQLNNNPQTQGYYDYNNSQKQTDMEYIDLQGEVAGFQVDNKLYTYAYTYPELQNNGYNLALIGSAGQGAPSIKIPTLTGSTKATVVGVASTDIVGYLKDNDYRAYGDILKAERDIDAGYASGTFRTGLWVEQGNNGRLQEYYDYTKGLSFPALGNSLQASYKLDLDSHMTNYQPFIEYDWRPIDNLVITPGFKYEWFERNQDALVEQTTLQPLTAGKTYSDAMPFLSGTYHVNKEMSVYAQASQGYLVPPVEAFYQFVPGNSNVQAQRTTNYQIGTVYKSEKFAGDVDLYQITATNFGFTTTPTSGPQQGESIYTDAGTARYRGLEAEGTYQIVHGLGVYGSGALMQAKYIASTLGYTGMRVGDAPSYTATVGLIYDDGQIFGSFLTRFIGDYYGSSGQSATTATTNGSLNHVGAYNTSDFVIGYRTTAAHDMWGIGQVLRVKLGVYNILDHRNITEIAGSTSGVTSINNTALTYSFLPGVTIAGGVGIDF